MGGEANRKSIVLNSHFSLINLTRRLLINSQTIIINPAFTSTPGTYYAPHPSFIRSGHWANTTLKNNPSCPTERGLVPQGSPQPFPCLTSVVPQKLLAESSDPHPNP